MSRFTPSDLVVAALIAAAILFGALGFSGFGDRISNTLLFAAWSLTLLTLFALAVRLPLRGRGSQWTAWAANALIVCGALGAVIAANVALYRHDVHFDATREGLNTPPQQLTDVVDQLRSPLSMTYFYNAGDPNALAARDMIEIAARNHPLLAFRAIDLDKEPGLARDIGVHSYNTAVLQAGDRKVLVENVTDAARLGYAALRVLRQRAETICFVTGHGETFRPMPGHYHFSHVETLRGHDMPGADDVLVAEPEQLDRFQLALDEIGFEMRPLVMAMASAIPANCTVVAEIGPRTALAAGEADLLAEYLKSGGRVAMFDRSAVSPWSRPAKPFADPAGPVERTGHHRRSAESFSHRSGQGRGALLSLASDHGASSADGVCAGAGDPPQPATGGGEGQCPCRQQPGQLLAAAVGRRRHHRRSRRTGAGRGRA